jgi:hypothetical protein
MTTDPYIAHLEADIERTKARTKQLRAETDRLEAEQVALKAESAELEASIEKARLPWMVDRPFLRSFLLLGLPVALGYFIREEHRTLDRAPTGIALMVGVTLGVGALTWFLLRHQRRAQK